MALLQLPLALTALPWGGRLCREACSYPGAGDVIRRLYGRLSRLAALLNPFPLQLPDGTSTQARVSGRRRVSGRPCAAAAAAGGTSLPAVLPAAVLLLASWPCWSLADPATATPHRHQPQAMCCTISTYSLLVCAVVAPLFAAYHQEAAQRRLFLRVWRRRGGALATRGSGSSEGSSGLSLEPSTPSSSTSSRSHSRSASGEEAGAATPPLVMGRARHARLRRRLQQLSTDPTAAAEREQEAVAELLQRSPPRPLRWVLAEAAAVALLSWPLVVVGIDAGAPWLCAQQ